MSGPSTMGWLRTAAGRVSVGSSRLVAHCIGRVLKAAHARVTSWAWWAQLALAFLVVYRGPVLLAHLGDWAHRKAASGVWARGMFFAAGLWVVAAYRAGHSDWKPRSGKEEPAAQPEQAADDEADEPAATVSLEKPLLPILPDLRISLAKVGTPHAHLAVLAADIGTTPERVREALDKWKIPVEAVRMQGRGTSTGVKGGPAVHPALALRPEDAAVVAAGQPSNNNSNNAFTTVPDDVNPVRTHVVWHDQQTVPAADQITD